MLKTNLSTRPFYNERAVHLGLALVTLLLVVVTAYNVNRIVSLSARNTTLGTAAEQAESSAAALRQSAARIRSGIDTKELDAVAAQARQANAIISRRTFSWTELFNRFEATLPPQVRITAVRPKIDKDGVVLLEVDVLARSVDDVNTFMNQLEATGAFIDLLSREEHVMESGLLQATLSCQYVPGAANAAAAPAAESGHRRGTEEDRRAPMTLVRRILAEKRSIILPLAVALLANLGVYVLVVYPLKSRVAGASARQTAAEQSLQAAERANAAAHAIQEGKDRADQELTTFYRKVLPADLSGARRITYARLTELAQKAHLRYRNRSFDPEDVRNSDLKRLRITMVLEGNYGDVRQFIYALETTPEFIVLDDVALVQNNQANAALILTLELSTYYRAGGDGS